MLTGLWRGDKDILDEAVPKANKFATLFVKYPEPTINHLLTNPNL